MNRQYGRRKSQYLSIFTYSVLYGACARLEDRITSYQEAESEMYASIRNNIRSVEPQKLLRNVVDAQRGVLVRRQDASHRCTSPVPTQIEKQLALILRKYQSYQDTVRIVDCTKHMEATVKSRVDASLKKKVVFSETSQPLPVCCLLSTEGDGYPCWHGAAVIREKYGSVNLFNLIAPTHISSIWKTQYDSVLFRVPDKYDVDRIVLEAEELVSSGQHISIPVALAPTRGHPIKNTEKTLRYW